MCGKKLHFKVRQYDRPTDRSSNRPTDKRTDMRDQREVTLAISKRCLIIMHWISCIYLLVPLSIQNITTKLIMRSVQNFSAKHWFPSIIEGLISICSLMSVGRSDGWSICHNFLSEGREVILQCSHRSTCYLLVSFSVSVISVPLSSDRIQGIILNKNIF